MRLHHDMTVPASTDEVWRALGEIDAIAPCLPGASVERVDADTDTVYGSMTVKVGPITVAYQGRAVIDERDDTGHRMVVHASGRERRGAGTAQATLVVEVHEQPAGGGSEVDVDTDLTITGRPAQFGRGVMADIGDRVVAEFADRLSRQLATQNPPPPGLSGATALSASGTDPGAEAGAGPEASLTDGSDPAAHGSTVAAGTGTGPTDGAATGRRERAPGAGTSPGADARAAEVTGAGGRGAGAREGTGPGARGDTAASAARANDGAAGAESASGREPGPREGAGMAAPAPQAGRDEPLDLGPILLPVVRRALRLAAVALALAVVGRILRHRRGLPPG
ncbi:carbon monoxide dehydrogenase subunit G [Streptacidiphilus sp. MAP12-33]|uniref:SRPBCC family protein n=1 Tax=Streptacidiphilus sp. MAP12-33 TaxID=3156266 RepID=UPI003517BB51